MLENLWTGKIHHSSVFFKNLSNFLKKSGFKKFFDVKVSMWKSLITCRNQKWYYAVLHITIVLWGSFVTLFYNTTRLLHFFTHIILFVALFIAASIVNFYKILNLGNDFFKSEHSKFVFKIFLEISCWHMEQF